MSLIVEGEAAVSTDRRVAGHRVALHSLDIASIGAGGGSIAHVDAGGVLHIGPASAGADPGTACYARGGTSPTVTDADLVLGFLDPRRFPGGRQHLDSEAAAAAVDTIAARLGIGRVEAAEGIHRRLARAVRPRPRLPGPGTADPGSGHPRVGDDHGAPEGRRCRAHDPARLAGHRNRRRMNLPGRLACGAFQGARTER